jgi:hypothetical protein
VVPLSCAWQHKRRVKRASLRRVTHSYINWTPMLAQAAAQEGLHHHTPLLNNTMTDLEP